MAEDKTDVDEDMDEDLIVEALNLGEHFDLNSTFLFSAFHFLLIFLEPSPSYSEGDFFVTRNAARTLERFRALRLYSQELSIKAQEEEKIFSVQKIRLLHRPEFQEIPDVSSISAELERISRKYEESKVTLQGIHREIREKTYGYGDLIR